MTEAFPTRKHIRRRERKGTKATDKATVAAYNRDGLAGITEALGAGSPDEWQQEDEE